MMNSKLKPFDMAEQLRSEDDIVAYLSMVLEDGDTDELIAALGYIAKARGMAQIARESGLGRESLYKALRLGSRPQFDTILKVIKALGLELRIVK
jgi:probable addiction module antidote protein